MGNAKKRKCSRDRDRTIEGEGTRAKTSCELDERVECSTRRKELWSAPTWGQMKRGRSERLLRACVLQQVNFFDDLSSGNLTAGARLLIGFCLIIERPKFASLLMCTLREMWQLVTL